MKKKFRIMMIVFYTALVILIAVTFRVMIQSEGQVLFAYIMAALTLIVLAFLIGEWLEKGVIRPVDKLKEAISHMIDGDAEYILDDDSADELGELSQEFDRLRIKINSENEIREQFNRENRELIGNISHDLKTPITAIKGYAEGLIDGIVRTPEQQQKYLRTIRSKAEDMAKLIDELAYYTKIDTNRIPYSFAKVSPTEFFYDCVEEVGLDLESRGIVFTDRNTISGRPVIIGDVEQLKKVIYNIINNAAKYLDKKPGTIEIRLMDDGDFVRFEIADNGKGIAKKDLPYIFDRFYRTDTSRNSMTGGSGIGLSISKKIIEDHGGRIWAVSREGVGTTFIFILRKYQEASDNE